jgi:hypothetical protein
MLEQRLKKQAGIPLLSCADIAILLKSVLPLIDTTGKRNIKTTRSQAQKKTGVK